MKKIIVLIVSAFLSVSCNSEFMPYLTKNFEVGQTYSTTTGSVIIWIETGRSSQFNTDYMVGYKQELIYSGSANGVLQISYREYNNQLGTNYIRDAFTQQLQYDLKEGNVITFRDLKIEIIEATSSKITYKVTQWLGEEKLKNEIEQEQKQKEKYEKMKREGNWG